MIGPANMIGHSYGQQPILPIRRKRLQAHQEHARAARITKLRQQRHYPRQFPLGKLARPPLINGRGLNGAQPCVQRFLLLAHRERGKLAVKGRGQLCRCGIAFLCRNMRTACGKRPSFPIKGPRPGNDGTAAQGNCHEVALRQGRVIQETERDEAGQEFRFLPAFATEWLAMKRCHAIRILRVIQPHQLAGKNLPFGPYRTRDFGAQIGLKAFRDDPACRRVRIPIPAAHQARPFRRPANIKRAQ